MTSSFTLSHFTRFQPSGSQSVVPETPASASFGIVQNPDYHPRSTDLETEGREDRAFASANPPGVSKNMPESADHCSVYTEMGAAPLCPESLGFLPSLQLLNQGSYF